jgi:hypothetical protein
MPEENKTLSLFHPAELTVNEEGEKIIVWFTSKQDREIFQKLIQRIRDS